MNCNGASVAGCTHDCEGRGVQCFDRTESSADEWSGGCENRSSEHNQFCRHVTAAVHTWSLVCNGEMVVKEVGGRDGEERASELEGPPHVSATPDRKRGGKIELPANDLRIFSEEIFRDYEVTRPTCEVAKGVAGELYGPSLGLFNALLTHVPVKRIFY